MNILLIIATIVIVALSLIASYYLLKVRQLNKQQLEQNKQNQAAWQANQDELIKDIQFIANSMLQQQCEITEGCMRLGYLIPKVDDSEAIKNTFKHIYNHYTATAHMPIKEAYQALDKKEQFKLDSERFSLEAKNTEGVLQDCKKLAVHIFIRS